MIVLVEVLLMVPDNHICVVSPSKYTKNLEKTFRTGIRSVFSLITFSLQNDDHKPVDFKGASISYTCQLFKI